MVSPRVVAVLLLALFVPGLFAVSYTFNPDNLGNCTTAADECDINSPVWWIPVPNGTFTGADSLTIISNATFPVVLILQNQTTLASLFLGQNVNLTVNATQTLVVEQLTLNETSSLTVNGQISSSDANGVAAFNPQSQIDVVGVFNWTGSASFTTSTFTVEGAATVNFGSVSFNFAAGSTINSLITASQLTVSSNIELTNGLTVNSLTVTAGAALIVDNFLNGGQANVAGNLTVNGPTVFTSSANTPALSGTGFILIELDDLETANITYTTPGSFNGTLEIEGGNSYLNSFTTALSFGNDNQTGVNTAINANNVVITGNATSLYGTLYVVGGGVTVTGTQTYLQSVFVTNSTLTVQGTLNADIVLLDGQLEIGGTVVPPTDIDDGETGSVLVPLGSSLGVISAKGVIVGDLVSFGVVNTSVDNELYINGNFAMWNSSLNAVVSNANTPALTVTGSIVFLGTNVLQFSMKSKPFLKSSAKFLVATANVTVNGTFTDKNANYLAGSALERSLEIAYDNTDIWLKYTFHASDVEYWMWIVLAVVVVVVVVGIVAVVVKCRKRTQYEPVR